MKISAAIALLAVVSSAYGHTIFQKISVNGADQGALRGIRYPSTNNPIQNVNDNAMACNYQHQKDNNVINVPAGARVGAWWGHVIGGAQFANDPDHPIAASHKGPTMFYLAKVDNAASTSANGLRWFKVAEEGLNNGNGQWGVDTLIRNQGWHYFTVPTCLAPGNYLLRAELIGLHSAYTQGGAQFYVGCAQINLTGGGSVQPSDTVSFPGAYQGNHPGITISIYQGTIPNNAGRPYSIPGPRVFECPAGSNNPPPVVTQPPVQNPNPPPPVSTPPPTSPGGAPLYGQCGGMGWSGATSCQSGICKAVNDYYSQCVPS